MAMSVVYATVNGRLVQENRGGTVTRYIADTLGSVIQTRDAAGNQTSSTIYWPFGEVSTNSCTNPSPWGFCGTWGYFRDAASRLYVRARYYLQKEARWNTLDPIWPHESAYAYARENPTASVDPRGMSPKAPGQTKGKECAVYQCDQNPGMWGFKPGHRFICGSVKRPDGSSRACSAGLYPKHMDGRVIIGPGEIGDSFSECPPSGENLRCTKIVSGWNNHDVCRFTDQVCRCMDRARRDPGLYSLPVRNCIDFSAWLLECACEEGGPYPGLLGGLCSNWISTGFYRR